jgi:hypothetical protein
VNSAARGPLTLWTVLGCDAGGHRVHTALARRAHAAGYRTFCVHDLRLIVVGDASHCHQLSLTSKPDSLPREHHTTNEVSGAEPRIRERWRRSILGQPPARRRPRRSRRQCRRAAEQRSGGETSPPWCTSRRSRARPERTIVIELAADLISSFCEAHRR